MKKEIEYELLKDLSVPGLYIRAGKRMSKIWWEIHIPTLKNIDKEGDWFLRIEHNKPNYENSTDKESIIVKNIFKSKGLKSISYTEAAIQAARAFGEYIKDKLPTEKQINEEALKLFPYEDGNVEDDIAAYKRAIFKDGCQFAIKNLTP